MLLLFCRRLFLCCLAISSASFVILVLLVFLLQFYFILIKSPYFGEDTSKRKIIYSINHPNLHSSYSQSTSSHQGTHGSSQQMVLSCKGLHHYRNLSYLVTACAIIGIRLIYIIHVGHPKHDSHTKIYFPFQQRNFNCVLTPYETCIVQQ